MEMLLIRGEPQYQDTECVVVPLLQDEGLGGAAQQLDAALGGALGELVSSGDLSGKLGQSQLLYRGGEKGPRRVLVIGCGTRNKLSDSRFQRIHVDAAKAVAATAATEAVVYLPEIPVPDRDLAWKLRVGGLAMADAAYRYTATLSQVEDDGPGLAKVGFAVPGDATGAEQALEQARAMAEGSELARILADLPANICTPAYMAERAQELASRHDAVELTVLEREQMSELGMGALLGVAAGSETEPKLILLHYRGAGADSRPYCLIGKGITFDTGGISLKPRESMEEMKFDMCGGASVMGAFAAAVRLELPINLIAAVPAVENMPDGRAYRPGDVVTTMSGQTVEVLNTDAEGRLVMCDTLTYIQRFEPEAIVDAATLTGACVVALGDQAIALLSADDELADSLLAAGDAVFDRAWRLPLWDEYHKQLETPHADVANIGGRGAGAITAGCFLSRFAEGYRWAHLDIAGTAWQGGKNKGATGRSVALLTRYLVERAGLD